MDCLNELLLRYPVLGSCEKSLSAAYKQLSDSFTAGGRLYICGNGGSAADALHIAGELVKSFVLPRSLDSSFTERVTPELAQKLEGALPAYPLVENIALASAYANDVDPEYIFAQQVYAYARPNDCVMGISTSGRSKNVIRALEAARGRGASTLGLTGRDGGDMKELCDVCIIAPEWETYKIQELHLPIYHTLCMMLEEKYWGKK